MLEEFGALIQQLRITRGLSASEFGQRAGVSSEVIEDLEHGRSNYSVGVLAKISRGLGMHVSAIFRIWDARELAYGSLADSIPARELN